MPEFFPYIYGLSQGKPAFLLRNISTESGLVKGRQFWGLEAHERIAIVK
jgi:hypothetical protein